MSGEMIPWDAKQGAVVPASATSPSEIIKYAVRHLRSVESKQLISAFESQNYEMGTTFIWSKAMFVLKAQLATLGSEFVGEMLQRPDIDEYSDVRNCVTDTEAISLAEDLGMIAHTDCFRMRQSHEVISYFARLSSQPDADEEAMMEPEEAIGCLRACVKNVLAQPIIEVAHSFADFRKQLEETNLSAESEAITSLVASPYFYRRTTLSVLLALLKTTSGASLEHVGANINTVLPLLWPDLKKPQRWQAGQTYAQLFNDGSKSPLSYLKKALLKVKGFDFVPENLRSNTFTRAAREVLSAHESMNNFYNEPAKIRLLENLGTTIPEPAFPLCMTAILSIWLGNSFGNSWDASPIASKLLDNLSQEQWQYYLDGCLAADRAILLKLFSSKPRSRWVELVKKYDLHTTEVDDRRVRSLLKVSEAGRGESVQKAARRIYASSTGSSVSS
ncbi:hypothetical protein [Fuerstiella marisgermanici]|uniref:Uncharacterized protein n=1 Tax=Fuerstiella marisgermanici TaxID=1891926 RepID=A0A1P8WP82_9PLAN|nr:hypothetical protein [Fuerstiella marisgermanici]APZ95872.1 hypothetical protein Fuma_05535 [Fuerstiella marisgermanici]